MVDFDPCGCIQPCPAGMSQQYQVTIPSAPTNLACTHCADVGTSWVLLDLDLGR